MNLWIGGGKRNHSVSSGLHHDFHDNFYLLGRGTKSFTLISPADANRVYLNGEIEQIHPNGLITYKTRSRDKVRADGAFESDVLKWEIKKAQELIERSKGKIEKKKGRKILNALLLKLSDLSDDDYAFKGSAKRVAIDQPESPTKSEPLSFSKISPHCIHQPDKIKERFPLFKDVEKLEFTLKEGEMLYIPAAWFHEVRSTIGTESEKDYHIALNYWYAPPSTADPLNCYSDKFWKLTHWAKIRRILDKI
jgi:hypothetical protein